MRNVTRPTTVWLSYTFLVTLTTILKLVTQVEALPRDGSLVALRAFNGQNVTAIEGGGRELVADSDWIGPSAIFKLKVINREANLIALQTLKGQYLVANSRGGAVLATSRSSTRRTTWFKLLTLDGNQVALQAHNGQYVTAEEDGSHELLANRDAISSRATFELKIINLQKLPQRIALRTHNGQYMMAENGGGRAVLANSNWIGAWETFQVEIINRRELKVALKTFNGQYVTAEPSGAMRVVATSTEKGPNAIFTLPYLEVSKGIPTAVALRARGGRLVGAVNGGGSTVVAARNTLTPWESFELTALDTLRIPTKIALRASKGQFLVAEDGGGGAVLANRDVIGLWGTFKLRIFANPRHLLSVALRAENNQYVTANSSGDPTVLATSTAIGPNEKFGLLLVDVRDGLPTSVTLRAQGGRLVSAQDGGGGAVVVKPGARGPAETFQLINREVRDAPHHFLSFNDDLKPKLEAEFGEPDYLDTYYGKVDPNGERTTLQAWKAVNGFNTPPVMHARYINAGDLGFGRDMFCRENGNGPSCYVRNYLDPKDENRFAATVTMERMHKSGRTFVAFFAYDARGKRINQIELDTEGPKSIPESCYACHKGYTDDNGDPHGGRFLPFDIVSFEDWPGRPTRAAQLDAFRDLNQMVRNDAKRYADKQFLDELIEGWYGLEANMDFNGTEYYDAARLPDENWYSADETRRSREQFLYTVYATSCRTCHVAQGHGPEVRSGPPFTDGINWQMADIFEDQAYYQICDVDSALTMPHAEVTFNKFNRQEIHFTNGKVATAKAELCAQQPPGFVPQRQANIENGAARFGPRPDGFDCQSCHNGERAPDLACKGARVFKDLGRIYKDMSFLGVLGAQDVADIRAYLNSFSQCPTQQ